MLTTEALVTDIPEEEKAPPMPPGGGMGAWGAWAAWAACIKRLAGGPDCPPVSRTHALALVIWSLRAHFSCLTFRRSVMRHCLTFHH